MAVRPWSRVVARRSGYGGSTVARLRWRTMPMLGCSSPSRRSRASTRDMRHFAEGAGCCRQTEPRCPARQRANTLRQRSGDRIRPGLSGRRVLPRARSGSGHHRLKAREDVPDPLTGRRKKRLELRRPLHAGRLGLRQFLSGMGDRRCPDRTGVRLAAAKHGRRSVPPGQPACHPRLAEGRRRDVRRRDPSQLRRVRYSQRIRMDGSRVAAACWRRSGLG